MSKFSIRRASISDLTGIVALLADDALGRGREDASEPLKSQYTQAFAAIDHDPNQLLIVMETGDELAACLQLTFIPGLSRSGMWRGQIESVRVARRHRGQGLGRELFEWAIAECRERDCGLVQLTTDKTRTDAAKFYKSLGFVASHEGMKLSL